MGLSLLGGSRLVAATHNAGKAREIAALLDSRFALVTAAELGLAEPEETESTFVGNAVLKARAAADASGEIAIADDSGLSVAALDGAPGVLSARWAAEPRNFTLAMARVRRELEAAEASDYSAWFTCALAVAWPDGPVVAVEGQAHGALTFPPRGAAGFGYDPIFVPSGAALTFAEMAAEHKDAASHRTRAFAKLKAALW